MDPKKTLRTDGNIYIPIEKREGPESIVYFTRDLSAEGLEKYTKKLKKISMVKSELNYIQVKKMVLILFHVLGSKISLKKKFQMLQY